MNILLINHYAGSPEMGMEYRPYYLGREWIRAGHRVRIIAASFSHLRIENPVLHRPVLRENKDGIEYFFLRTPAYSGNGGGRVINILCFLAALFRHQKKILDGFAPDVVIASSTYPLDNYPARRMARRSGAKFVYEVHDLWPLSPMELGGYSRRNPYIMVMQAAEDLAYRHCDCVVSLLPCAEPHMLERGLPPGRFAYVPNGIDTSEWAAAGETLPREHREVIAAAHAAGRLLVCYAGSHGLANALDSLLDAAKLSAALPITFVLVGGGPEKTRLEERIKAEGIVNAVSLPAVRKGAIPALLAEMDILFIGLQRQSLFRFGISPNKLMDYMMAGKPVVQAIEAGNDLTAEAGCGISVRPEDPAAIAEAIRRLAGIGPEERGALGESGRRYVLARHDYRVIAAEFIEAIRKE